MNDPTSREGSNTEAALASLAERIKAVHAEAERMAIASIDRALEAGRLLLEARDAVPHGGWLPWLKNNCALAERTAQLYMRMARQMALVPKSATVADLSQSFLPAESIRDAAAMLDLVPPSGCRLVADWAGGSRQAIIQPSRTAGCYFVTGIADSPDGGLIVEGTIKPALWWGLAMVLDHLLSKPFLGPERVPWRSLAWQAEVSEPTAKNDLLVDVQAEIGA